MYHSSELQICSLPVQDNDSSVVDWAPWVQGGCQNIPHLPEETDPHREVR